MKNSINESIKCALGLLIAITLTFIVVMIIFMGCCSSKQGELRPVYDALYIGGTFFGGFATLTAAYIASRMFNDWKDQHNKNIDAQLSMKAYDFIEEANYHLLLIFKFIGDYIDLKDKESLKKEFEENLKRLSILHDLTTTKLADLAYFVDINEYKTEYTKQIKIILSNLNDLLDTHKALEGKIFDDDQKVKIQEVLEELYIDTRDRYRSFVVELKKYYKA